MAPAPSSAGILAEDRLRTINTVAMALVGGLCCITAVGALLDVRRKAKRGAEPAEGGSPAAYWACGLCVSSYALLTPGLVTKLFKMRISVLDHSMTMHEADESTVTFIHTLASTGGWLGSAFIVAFAIVIPLAKILMLALGELWRNSSNPRRVACARRCIIVLRLVSKWACPDMFAYILMVSLVRSLSHPPTLDGEMQLDIGFTCFTLFCVGSTISSLGICLPQVPLKDGQAAEADAPPAEESAQPSFLQRRLGAKGTVRLALLVLVAWIALFAVGLYLPCMALRLDLDPLIESGMLPRSAVPYVVDTLHLPDLAKADVSIWKCMAAFVNWARATGDMNSLIGFAMLAVFVVLFTLLDMMLMTRVAEMILRRPLRRRELWLEPSRMMQASRALKKTCMTDVLIMGVLVVILSGSIYDSKGLVLSLRWGLASLAAAELCRHIVYGLLASALGGGAAADVGAADCTANAPAEEASTDSSSSSSSSATSQEASV